MNISAFVQTKDLLKIPIPKQQLATLRFNHSLSWSNIASHFHLRISHSVVMRKMATAYIYVYACASTLLTLTLTSILALLSSMYHLCILASELVGVYTTQSRKALRHNPVTLPVFHACTCERCRAPSISALFCII